MVPTGPGMGPYYLGLSYNLSLALYTIANPACAVNMPISYTLKSRDSNPVPSYVTLLVTATSLYLQISPSITDSAASLVLRLEGSITSG